MPKRPASESKSRRGKKKKVSTPAAPPPPPPFLYLRHGFVYEPERVTLDTFVCIPLSQLQNRAAVHDTVLRKVLYHLHSLPEGEKNGTECLSAAQDRPAPDGNNHDHDSSNDNDNGNGNDNVNGSGNDNDNGNKNYNDNGNDSDNENGNSNDNGNVSDSGSGRGAPAPAAKAAHETHRSVVHVEAIAVHADSARHVSHRGDVRLRVSVTAVLARVVHGLLPGVAEEAAFPDTRTVRLRGGRGPGGKGEGEGEGEPVRVTARCAQEESITPGQAVLLVSEPGALRCLAIRPPRVAAGEFTTRVVDDTMEIEADWAPKRRVEQN